ncbi:hypothetical protein ACFW04_013734 [Cataglyphis niger]
MYSVEGNSMNYYVEDVKLPPCKKELFHPFRRAVCILGRRYALTPTSYKYLEIGISVGTMSCVQLAPGENRGNQIVLPFEM